jgi:hypothetical protein
MGPRATSLGGCSTAERTTRRRQGDKTRHQDVRASAYNVCPDSPGRNLRQPDHSPEGAASRLERASYLREKMHLDTSMDTRL